jgi:uncharacterized protein (DUF488 family)
MAAGGVVIRRIAIEITCAYVKCDGNQQDENDPFMRRNHGLLLLYAAFMAEEILTIGHSTHPIEEFIGMLKAHGVQQLVDVRTIPKSRHNPQFESGALARSMEENNINYVHMPGLGGMRKPRAGSTNLGWKNASFRGYADYMQTAVFEKSLLELIRIAGERRTVIMCAEAVPWRCHRSLIGDALTARGIRVEDIFDASKRKAHQLTPFAKIDGENVSYPGLGLE